MADTFEKRVSLRMDPDDYERVEQLGREHARRPAEILRAAIILGCEVIEKQGDKAIKRALASGEGEA